MYWRDHDITYQADDVSWAALRPFADSPVVAAVDSVSVEANTYSGETATPVISTPEKVINLFDVKALSPYIVNPLLEVGVYGEDTAQVAIFNDVPLLRLLVLSAIYPAAAESAYIESETFVADVLYPGITDTLLDVSVCVDETLSAAVNAFYILVHFYGEDALYSVLGDEATATTLQDTVLKHLADTGWEAASIYMKQSDGTWQVKPLYMKQMETSWM